MYTAEFVLGDIYVLLIRACELLFKKHKVRVGKKPASLSYWLAEGNTHEIESINEFTGSVRSDFAEIVEKIKKLDPSLLDQFMSYLSFYQENITQLEKADTEELDDYLANLTFYILRDIQDFAAEDEKVKKRQKDSLLNEEVTKLLATSFSIYPN
jgi:hypothetical protein